jgi:hypothetical protein
MPTLSPLEGPVTSLLDNHLPDSNAGPLNPLAREDRGDGNIGKRMKALEEEIKRLHGALRYEMRVSQALADILVENGLISSEQLKNRLRRNKN